MMGENTDVAQWVAVAGFSEPGQMSADFLEIANEMFLRLSTGQIPRFLSLIVARIQNFHAPPIEVF